MENGHALGVTCNVTACRIFGSCLPMIAYDCTDAATATTIRTFVVLPIRRRRRRRWRRSRRCCVTINCFEFVCLLLNNFFLANIFLLCHYFFDGIGAATNLYFFGIYLEEIAQQKYSYSKKIVDREDKQRKLYINITDFKLKMNQSILHKQH